MGIDLFSVGVAMVAALFLLALCRTLLVCAPFQVLPQACLGAPEANPNHCLCDFVDDGAMSRPGVVVNARPYVELHD